MLERAVAECIERGVTGRSSICLSCNAANVSMAAAAAALDAALISES